MNTSDNLLYAKMTTKQLQCASYGNVYPAPADTLYLLYIRKRRHTARVGYSIRYIGKYAKYFIIDSGFFSFHIHSVNQEFITVIRQNVKGSVFKPCIAEFLPPVGNYIICSFFITRFIPKASEPAAKPNANEEKTTEKKAGQ